MSIAAIGAVPPALEPTFQSRAGAAQAGAAFTLATAPAIAPTLSAGSAPGVTPVAMLSLQEVGPAGQHAPPPGDREARRRGRDLLAALTPLQRDLLSTSISTQGLAWVRDALADIGEPEDPQLAGILGAIRLRAAIASIGFARASARRPLIP